MMSDNDGNVYLSARELCIKMGWRTSKDMYINAMHCAVHGSQSERTRPQTAAAILNLYASLLQHADIIDVKTSNTFFHIISHYTIIVLC